MFPPLLGETHLSLIFCFPQEIQKENPRAEDDWAVFEEIKSVLKSNYLLFHVPSGGRQQTTAKKCLLSDTILFI